MDAGKPSLFLKQEARVTIKLVPLSNIPKANIHSVFQAVFSLIGLSA